MITPPLPSYTTQEEFKKKLLSIIDKAMDKAVITSLDISVPDRRQPRFTLTVEFKTK